jgi:hypothetical protein
MIFQKVIWQKLKKIENIQIVHYFSLNIFILLIQVKLNWYHSKALILSYS